MVNQDNKMFWELYEKTQDKIQEYAKKVLDSIEFGVCAPSFCDQSKLLATAEYLESIKESKFTYTHVNGLTSISVILKSL